MSKPAPAPVRPRTRFRRLASEIESSWSTDSTDAYTSSPVSSHRPARHWDAQHHHTTANKWASIDLFKPRTFQTHPPASATAQAIHHDPLPPSRSGRTSMNGRRSFDVLDRSYSGSSSDSAPTETYGAGPSCAPSSSSEAQAPSESDTHEGPRARPFRWDTRSPRLAAPIDLPTSAGTAKRKYSLSSVPSAPSLRQTNDSPLIQPSSASNPTSPELNRLIDDSPVLPSVATVGGGALDRLRKRLSGHMSSARSTLTPGQQPGQDDLGTASASASGSGGAELLDAAHTKFGANGVPPAHGFTLNSTGFEWMGTLERVGAYLATYHVDTNHLAETTLLVSAALGVAWALYNTSIPALQKPAYGLLAQTIIAVGIDPFLRFADRYFCPSGGKAKVARQWVGAPASTTTYSTDGRSDRSASRKTKTHLHSPQMGNRGELQDEPERHPRDVVYRPAGKSRTDARYVWGLAPKRFLRDARDQGLTPGLVLGPLLASACLLDAVRAERAVAAGHLPSPVGEWRLPPWPAHSPIPAWAQAPPPAPPAGLGSLSSARLALSSMHTLVFVINITHICAMHWLPTHWTSPARTIDRTRNFVLFYGAVTCALALAAPMGVLGLLGVSVAGHESTPASGGLSVWEVILTSGLYQTTLLTTVALARRNFTYCEVVVTVAFGVTIMVEASSLSIARITRSLVPHTFRAPNALLVFQLALLVGTFTIGFLTSPLLYLSRSLAQRPTHRLRWPEKRHGHRKILSASFYSLAAIFIAGVLGPWVHWLLHTNPWVWTIRFVAGLETLASPPGSRGWRDWSASPLALLAWWAGCLVATAIFWAAAAPGTHINSANNVFIPGGPSRRTTPNWPLSRARLSKRASHGSPFTSPPTILQSLPTADGAKDANGVVDGIDATVRPNSPSSPLQATFPNGTMEKAKDEANGVSAQTGPGRAKRSAIWLSLNAKRKFFHLLAIALFVPGFLLNPAFTHLAISVAFALFILCEYTRYFALYPMGAPLHVFLSRFLDSKDQNGPVILSPFYLLQGCALPLWLEARPSALARCSAALALGIADATASVVGRKVGRIRWPQSRKTVEGTLAFIVSLTLSGLFVHMLFPEGAHTFSLSAWTLTATALGLLEGVMEQNDNLVLPIYSFVLTSLFEL